MARRYLYVLVAVLFGTASLSTSGQRGPGLPTTTFDPGSLFQLAAHIPTSQIPNEHGTAVMVQGYAVVPYANGLSDGGFAVVDISNPFRPAVQKLIPSLDSREGHAIGFYRTGDQLFSVSLASTGILFWNWSDILNAQLVAKLDLPGIEASDYDNGVWWVFWQAPYVYVGGSSRGLFVVNAENPAQPFLANQVPAVDLGLLRVGSVTAVGNLLFASPNDVSGFSILDISDPVHPSLLFNEPRSDQYAVYSSMVNGNKFLLAGNGGRQGLLIYDVSNPRAPRFERMAPTTDKGGYLTVQDGIAHYGSSDGYYKIVIDGPDQGKILGVTRRNGTFQDIDFVSVLGNLVMFGDDDGFGTGITIHDRNPDRNPPSVTMVNPPNDARDVAVTSRVGITLSDQIDLDSITPDAFGLRHAATGQIIDGRLSGQTGIVNFSPNRPLEPGTEYQVVVQAGRLRDVAGNAIATTFVSRFTTAGPKPSTPCSLILPPVTVTGASVDLSIGDCVLPSGSTVTWSFGDGTSSTSGGGHVAHQFSAAGHYVVLATIQDSAGVRTVDARLTVARTLSPQRRFHSSTIAVSERNRSVWVVNSDQKTVSALTLEGDRKLFETTVGGNPVSLTIDGSNGVWVANKDWDSISIVDARNGTLVETLWLERGSAPSAIVYAPVRQRVYVSLEGFQQVLEIDVATRTFGRAVNVGPFPGGLALWPDESRLLVSRFVSPADQGTLSVVALDSFGLERSVTLKKDPGPDTESSGRGVPNYLFTPTVSPDGTEVWVPSKKDDTERGQFRSGEPLTFENTVRSIVSRIAVGSLLELNSSRVDLDNRNLPVAVEFSSLGDYALVATAGTNTVDIVDAYSGQRFASLEHLGLSPRGLVVDTAGQRLYVHSLLSRDVTIVDITPLATGMLPVVLGSIRTIDRESLSPQILRGKQIFYNSADARMAKDGYLSCATCHFDGGSDLRVWDFTDRGEGLRKTIPLVGRAGMGHGPVHWTGNMDEIQDFDGDIRNGFKGAGFLPADVWAAQARGGPLGPPVAGFSEDLDALAAYVGSLTALRPSPYRAWSSPTRAANGKALFQSTRVGCTTCHSGAQLTDSALGVFHDVGTIQASSGKRAGAPLIGFDTPTLRGVWATAPYLHDGSAPTLRSVLRDRNPLDKHGFTSQLSDQEIDDIVAYLHELD